MERTATILHIALQITANLSIVCEPFLPFSAERLRSFLQTEKLPWEQLGRFDLLEEGHRLGKAELLFEKIEDTVIEHQIQKLLETRKTNEANEYRAQAVKEHIQFDTFEKLDIRVGTVLECEKVPKADKLLRFLLDDGLEKRTILSGIAAYYPNPQELVGRQVCFIANLEPRKLRGILSEGMILSAENSDGTLALISPTKEVMPGSPVT
jgi:methionyl-tRNA synthetase